MKHASLHQYIVLGLGNPGDEYETTRHNAGRNAVMLFAKEHNLSPFAEDKKIQSLVSENKMEGVSMLLALPETYMNKSGEAAKRLKLKSKKQIASSLIIIHDDLDLPLGTIKIVKNRGSAGHKGVESITRSLVTKDFTRIRIGIAKPIDIKKSQSKTTVHTIIIGKQTPQEKTLLQKGIKKAASALETIAKSGVSHAMNEHNSNS